MAHQTANTSILNTSSDTQTAFTSSRSQTGRVSDIKNEPRKSLPSSSNTSALRNLTRAKSSVLVSQQLYYKSLLNQTIFAANGRTQKSGMIISKSQIEFSDRQSERNQRQTERGSEAQQHQLQLQQQQQQQQKLQQQQVISPKVSPCASFVSIGTNKDLFSSPLPKKRTRKSFGTKSILGGSSQSNNRNHEIEQKFATIQGDAQQGPTVFQLTCNYVFFLVFLVVANQTTWAPYIRFHMAFLYAIMAFTCLQFARLVHARDKKSAIMFYLSVVPFCYFLFISRESHILGFMLWFSMFLLVFLQSGLPNLKIHLVLYPLLNCPFIICGQPFSSTMSWKNEIMISAVSLTFIFHFIDVHKYIRRNAVALLDRDGFIRQLFTANIELRRQLRREKAFDVVDLESPLTKVLQILEEVRDSEFSDATIVKEIDIIMKILNSDQLYTPDIHKSADADVGEWLKMMIQTTNNSNTSDPLVANKPPPTEKIISPITTTAVPSLKFPTPIEFFDDPIFSNLQENFHDPSFDVHTIEKSTTATSTRGGVLFYIGYHLFHAHNLLAAHRIPDATLRAWLAHVELGYRSTNPYHNALHAADVTHSMNYYITRARVAAHLSHDDRLAALMAAIIHDYMHPGVNNNFLISTRNPLAMRYNDVAVLESFHCSAVFEAMAADPGLDILAGLGVDSARAVREMVVGAVLATDIATHFDWIGKFKNKVGGGAGASLNLGLKVDKRLVLNMAIKCADVNNPTKPLECCKFWTEKIMEEFFRQGDEEQRRGLNVSMFMNRGATDIPKCQIGFIDFIVYPLFEYWKDQAALAAATAS
ncbi:High affinity cAMP-specific 3',5'-cyclic phosphodiesterase 7A [Physocladia obscura]|uniref:Phosphodiesterase n=1 Tax=Physocladia obscura TaxID=109957 RepID=A0AAD5XH44_9FUNG|nr:High affinity cAMP-specific 3',5'-cyclic phosphodiesterase 7A [Physocladia obscura]